MIGMAGVFLYVRPAVVYASVLDSTESSAITEIPVTIETAVNNGILPTTEISTSTAENKLSAVEISSITIVSKKAMKITWKKNKSADGYFIYRKNKEGVWKKIGECVGGQKTTYVDKGLTYKKPIHIVSYPIKMKRERKYMKSLTKRVSLRS